jgi:phospholipid/cholesterol/gamma-HCH transport system permease protein
VHGITDEPHSRGELRCRRPTADTVLVEFSGSWRLQDEVPSLASLEQPLTAAPCVQRLAFDTTALSAWDSGLVTFVLNIMDFGPSARLWWTRRACPIG